MIVREAHLRRVGELLGQFPVVSILGARQVGKTTLARQFSESWNGPTHTFDLENPADIARLSEPLLALERLEGLVVIDEAQLNPDLFPVLRVLVDRPAVHVRFLLLGSASPKLVRGISESLAGRVAALDLDGFGLSEVGGDHMEPLWLRGGFPRSYLASSDGASATWREEFIRSVVERDLPGLGMPLAAAAIRRFWTMLAHLHGQVLNLSELGRAFGVSDTAVRRYVDFLAGAYLVRQLQPWHENISKRQVRSPKLYVADSGILHTLLGLRTWADVEQHPKVGASFEGFALEAVTTRLASKPEECHFWATHAGAELDLVVVRGNRRLGFEFKRSAAPRVTKSMRIALEDLKLDSIDVIHLGSHVFPLADGIRAVPVRSLGSHISLR
ncbi:MAG: ATP-binding protein [Deltaproteobacteria bacterium]|nr:ATP-binding protein [Deltaproteobacteria bacterium]